MSLVSVYLFSVSLFISVYLPATLSNLVSKQNKTYKTDKKQQTQVSFTSGESAEDLKREMVEALCILLLSELKKIRTVKSYTKSHICPCRK